MHKKISLFSLILLIVSGIDNLKNLPATALFGESLIFFFFLSTLVFLLPSALVSAELAASYPDKGGIYQWVTLAFGKKMGMAAIWLQWINTVLWVPSMLIFVAATLAYLIDPNLAQNKLYLSLSVLTFFWGLTALNLLGIRVSALLNNILATVGMALPMLLLIGFGAFWCFSGHELNIDFSKAHHVPKLTETSNWVSLIAIMASFLGMELSSVHVNDIQKPKKNFPKAALIACAFILLTMLGGSLSIAAVLPNEKIGLATGIMQVFASFLEQFKLPFFIPILAFLIVLGSLGTMINWTISPAKGLLHATEDGFLPPFFRKKNKNGVAVNILLVQACLVSLICLFLLLEPKINSSFWFLTAVSTELYMIMYLFMFSACLKLAPKKKDIQIFRIPGGVLGRWSMCLLGMSGSLATIFVSFIPSDSFAMDSSSRYLLLISGANVAMLIPLLWMFFKKKDLRHHVVIEMIHDPNGKSNNDENNRDRGAENNQVPAGSFFSENI